MTSLPLTLLTNTSFVLGDLVCVDSGIAVTCAEGLACVGVAFHIDDPTLSPNGRQFFATNGPAYYALDQYVYGEDLLSDFSEFNPNAAFFNPFTDTNVVTCLSYGQAPVLKNQTQFVQDKWILLSEGADYDQYLVSPFKPFSVTL